MLSGDQMKNCAMFESVKCVLYVFVCIYVIVKICSYSHYFWYLSVTYTVDQKAM